MRGLILLIFGLTLTLQVRIRSRTFVLREPTTTELTEVQIDSTLNPSLYTVDSKGIAPFCEVSPSSSGDVPLFHCSDLEFTSD
jgi:hypothetical protein